MSKQDKKSDKHKGSFSSQLSANKGGQGANFNPYTKNSGKPMSKGGGMKSRSIPQKKG